MSKELLVRKKFENQIGKVVFIEVETLHPGTYPEGTLKVTATVYPYGSGSYSSFINTSKTLDSIEQSIDAIGNYLLAHSIIGVREISDAISEHISPIFPQKDRG